MPEYHNLAQINIAKMKAPLDDPVMAGFVDQLDRINAEADAAPGFVWRMQDEDEAPKILRIFGDPLILVNMSVWQSVDLLFNYSYRSGHAQPFRDRRQWFDKMDRPHMALWWIPAGKLPTMEAGYSRLDQLAANGPSPQAFTFKKRFDPPR